MILKSGSLLGLFLLSTPHPFFFLGCMSGFLASLVIFIAQQIPCMKTHRGPEWCHLLQRGFGFLLEGSHLSPWSVEVGLSGVLPAASDAHLDLCPVALSELQPCHPSTSILPKSLVLLLTLSATAFSLIFWIICDARLTGCLPSILYLFMLSCCDP